MMEYLWTESQYYCSQKCHLDMLTFLHNSDTVIFQLQTIMYNINIATGENITHANQIQNTSSVNTSPGPGTGPLRSSIASVRSRNIFWTGYGPCVAFALLFLFISYKPHFTSDKKKKVIDVTASIK